MKSGVLAVLDQVRCFVNVDSVLSFFESGYRTGDFQLGLRALLREGDLAVDGAVVAGDLNRYRWKAENENHLSPAKNNILKVYSKANG